MDAPSFLFIAYGFLTSLVFVLGMLLAFMPYLMRRQECFAVTIPAAAALDPYLRQLKRRFALIMGALTLVLFAIALLLLATGADTEWDGLDWLIPSADAVLLVAYYLLMLFFRRKVQAYKQEQGWSAASQRSSAIIGSEAVSQISLRWNLLYLLVMVATLIAGILCYPAMPAMIPMHIGFDGVVSDWMPKGPAVIAFPMVIEGFMGACFTLCHWSINRARKWSDPNAPATSALAYGLYARAWNIYLLAFGLLLSASIGTLFLLSALGIASLAVMGAVLFFIIIFMVAGAIGLSIVYGQAGSRVFKRMHAPKGMPEDDDEHWKGGIIYFNPDDASLFLPERFGIGWTLNWARPAAWALVVGFIILTAGFVGTIFILVG